MLKFAIVLLCAGVCCGSKCCFPTQWEVMEGMIAGSVDDEGHTAITKGHVKMAYDATGHRIRLDENVSTGNITRTFVMLMLYQQSTMFIIENNTCSKSKLSAWGDQDCIPDNATLVSRYRIGQNPSLNVADYTWIIEPQQIVFTVTADGCVPVAEKLYRNMNGVSVMTGVGFQGITPGIKDPTIFTVPDICKGVSEPVSLINRRRILGLTHNIPESLSVEYCLLSNAGSYLQTGFELEKLQTRHSTVHGWCQRKSPCEKRTIY